MTRSVSHECALRFHSEPPTEAPSGEQAREVGGLSRQGPPHGLLQELVIWLKASYGELKPVDSVWRATVEWTPSLFDG